MIRLRDNYERLWADILERGQRSGVFRLADARVARLALLEMCNGVARWSSGKGPLTPAELADTFTDLALGMARAQSNQRPLRRTDITCLPTNDILAIIERELRDGSEAAAPRPTKPARPRGPDTGRLPDLTFWLPIRLMSLAVQRPPACSLCDPISLPPSRI